MTGSSRKDPPPGTGDQHAEPEPELFLLPEDEPAAGVRAPRPPGVDSLAAGQLAAALLVQAQALEGLRRTHSELLTRADQGAAQTALLRTAEVLRAAADGLQDTRAELLAEAGRRRGRPAFALALGVLVGAPVVLLAWLVGVEQPRARTELAGQMRADWGAWIDTERARTTQEREEWQAAAAEQAARWEGLVERVQHADDLAAALVATTAERDSLAADVAAVEAAAIETAERVRSLEQQLEQVGAEAATAQDERLLRIGEAARLRQQLQDRDRRLEEVGVLLASLNEDVDRRLAAQARPGMLETRGRAQPSLAGRVTAALEGAGVSRVRVLECSGVREDALRDLLLAWLDERGLPDRVVQVDSARLERTDGRLALRLQLAEGGSEALALADLDASAWAACGLRVPDNWLPLRDVTAALQGLLAGTGWIVEALGGFEDATLGSIVLVQRDERELPTRRLRAAFAEVVPVGPELHLREGQLEADGDARPFFENLYRLPLPGADFGAWLAATTTGAPR